LARRLNVSSKLGILLDPIGDKFFAIAVFGKLYLEGTLPVPLFISLFSREAALLLFTCFLWYQGKWKKYQIKSFLVGKMMTTCQFALLLALLFGCPIYSFYSIPFFLLGILSLFSLIVDSK
jgi:phosphatidylglycerophosphate synthase